MILINISIMDQFYTADISKVLSIPNPYSTQDMKEFIIDIKLYHHSNT